MSTSSERHHILARIFGTDEGFSGMPDAHLFLHERVRLFVKILFFFFSYVLLVGLLKAFVFMPKVRPEWVTSINVGNLITLGIAVSFGILWIYLRGGLRPVWILQLIDSVSAVLTNGAIGCTALWFPNAVPEFVLLLIVILVLVIRAALVPGSALRSVMVGLTSTAALTCPLWLNRPPASDEFEVAHYIWAIAAIWGIIFTVTTAIISRVIYGLRRMVYQAMQLGNYTLEQKLGEGGMGVVYLARHALLSRPTVVKLLPPEKAGEHNVTRFEREVQQSSRLSHPNTIEIYDFGHTPDGIFYYAMEYLEGLNLEELVNTEGPQRPARVIHILKTVAHALSEAHRAGLIHRDIKPANIVLCNKGGMADMAKVLDFGLVKDIKAPKELALSVANAVTGTPLFLAPECLTNPDQVDGRADLYALGAVGYFLLTGTNLFKGRTMVEVCSHHLHTAPEPPSRRLGRELPRDLEEVILRCVEKKPADRFADAMALYEALTGCNDANGWQLKEAGRWWEENGDMVRGFLLKKRQSLSEDQTAVLQRRECCI